MGVVLAAMCLWWQNNIPTNLDTLAYAFCYRENTHICLTELQYFSFVTTK